MKAFGVMGLMGLLLVVVALLVAVPPIKNLGAELRNMAAVAEKYIPVAPAKKTRVAAGGVVPLDPVRTILEHQGGRVQARSSETTTAAGVTWQVAQSGEDYYSDWR